MQPHLRNVIGNQCGTCLTHLREVSSDRIDPTIGNNGHDSRHGSTDLECRSPLKYVHE